jgi:D-serine deaminase-like pyridoxal phosphate-dependent protein
LTDLAHIDTPAALIDLRQMQANIDRMQSRMNGLGVAYRPHVKTSKCTPVARAQQAAGARGITVSTVKEASACFADGFDDILYAVGMVPAKLPQALALRRQGCQLKIITGSEAPAVADHWERYVSRLLRVAITHSQSLTAFVRTHEQPSSRPRFTPPRGSFRSTSTLHYPI